MCLVHFLISNISFILNLFLCQGSTGPPPDLVIPQEVSGDSTLPSMWLRFITVEEYNARSAKGEAPWGQVQGTRHRIPKVLSWLSHTATRCETQVKRCPPGSSLETRHQGFFLGAGHTGVLCLAPIRTPDSRKESRCSA